MTSLLERAVRIGLLAPVLVGLVVSAARADDQIEYVVAIAKAKATDGTPVVLERCVRMTRGPASGMICVFPWEGGELWSEDNPLVVESLVHPGKPIHLDHDMTVGDWLEAFLKKNFGRPSTAPKKNKEKHVGESGEAPAQLRGGDADTPEPLPADLADAKGRLSKLLIERKIDDVPAVIVSMRYPFDSSPSEEGAFKTMTTVVQPILEKALKQRADVAERLSQPIGSKDQVDAVDLGFELPKATALPSSTQSESSEVSALDEELKKTQNELNDIGLFEPQHPPTYRALLDALHKKDARDALAGLLSSPIFEGVITADKIRALEPDQRAPGIVPRWVWFALPGAVLLSLLVGALVAFYIWPGPARARRSALRNVAARSDFSNEARLLVQAIETAKTPAEFQAVTNRLRDHFIWLLLEGGYARAMRMLQERSVAGFVEPTKDGLELQVWKLVKDFNEIQKNAFTQYEQSFKAQGRERDAALEQLAHIFGGKDTGGQSSDEQEAIRKSAGEMFALTPDEVSLSQLVAKQGDLQIRASSFLDHILDDRPDAEAAFHYIFSGTAEPSGIIEKIGDLRFDAKALEGIEVELTGFSGLSVSGSRRDRATALAKAAGRVADQLRETVQCHNLDAAGSDAAALAGAVAREFDRDRANREKQREFAADFDHLDGALSKELLEGGRLFSEEVNTMKIREKYSKLIAWLRGETAAKQSSESQVQELYKALEAIKADLVKEKDTTARLEKRLTNDSDLLVGMLERAGIDVENAKALGLFDASGRVDADAVRRKESVLTAELALLALVHVALTKDLIAAKSGNRDDVVAALYLQKIVDGLNDLRAKYLAFQANGKHDRTPESIFMSIYAPCLESGWMHWLFRADRVLTSYYRQVPDLQSLRHNLSIAAQLAEIMLLSVGAQTTIPDLLVKSEAGEKRIFGAEDRFRALKNVRDFLAPRAAKGEDVAVDIYEIGIQATYRRFPPTVYGLNPVEWLK